jgi:hypothetical protein
MCHSTFAQGKTRPSGEKKGFSAVEPDVSALTGPLEDAEEAAGSELLYNEYIVYDTCQVKMKYVVQVKFNFV